VCTSLFAALVNIVNDTTVNITSKHVTLSRLVTMGSITSRLNNIAVTGNGVTIMCNNSGALCCESCHNVII